MEWLMGKARGVSRGLMSSVPSPSSETVSFEQALAPSLEMPEDSEEKRVALDSAPKARSDSTHRPFLQPSFLQQQLPILPTSSLLTDFPDLVQPCPALDPNEWLAFHVIALFENVATLFEAIYDLCTCRAGPEGLSHTDSRLELGAFERPSLEVATRGLIDISLAECSDIIQSSRIFPVKPGEPFCSGLTSQVAKICRHLLRCLAHIYMAHFEHLQRLELVAHANTLAKHFFSFTSHFNLLREEELGPLKAFQQGLLSVPAPSTALSPSTGKSPLKAKLTQPHSSSQCSSNGG